MDLTQAQGIAGKIIARLAPCCERLAVAGSVRRERPWVHDIDIVAIPANQGQFLSEVAKLGRIGRGGERLLQVDLGGTGFMVDFYIAEPATWPTLLLIRTGSAEHNRYLCTLARKKGLVLHADGRGLARPFSWTGDVPPTHEEEPLPVSSEEDIFRALGLPYKAPREREYKGGFYALPQRELSGVRRPVLVPREQPQTAHLL